MTIAPAFAVASLLAVACIDVSQINAPIVGSDAKTQDAGMEARAPVDVAPGSVAPGGQCNSNPDCADGTCVDGVCCLEPSCPLCHVCGSGGHCVKVAARVIEPHFRCYPPDLLGTCGKSGACDGLGACAFYPAGLSCGGGVCDVGSLVGALVCNGRGQCVVGPTLICAPFACEAGKCLESCDTDAQCVSGAACVQGSCGKRMKGAHCERDEDCASGFCSDRLCCNVLCDGPCVACNQAGREGTCFPIPLGSPDPHVQCADEGPTSCGKTGLCDGVGGCLLYPSTVVCSSVCSPTGSLLSTVHCNGMGACGPAVEMSACPTDTCDASATICR